MSVNSSHVCIIYSYVKIYEKISSGGLEVSGKQSNGSDPDPDRDRRPLGPGLGLNGLQLGFLQTSKVPASNERVSDIKGFLYYSERSC